MAGDSHGKFFLGLDEQGNEALFAHDADGTRRQATTEEAAAEEARASAYLKDELRRWVETRERIVNDPDLQPALIPEYTRYVALRSGLLPGEKPTLFDAQMAELEHRRLTYGSSAAAGDNGADDGRQATDTAHSADFRSVRWHGTDYSFTANQARVVKTLWLAWEQGTPDVGDETLLEAVDHESPPTSLRNLFRNNAAWGTMIVEGGSRGSHRLAEPKKNL